MHKPAFYLLLNSILTVFMTSPSVLSSPPIATCILLICAFKQFTTGIILLMVTYAHQISIWLHTYSHGFRIQIKVFICCISIANGVGGA